MHKRNNIHTNKRFASLIAVILIAAFMMQALSLCCFAATDRLGGEILSGVSGRPGLSGTSTGIGKFDTDATIEQLKKDLLT